MQKDLLISCSITDCFLSDEIKLQAPLEVAAPLDSRKLEGIKISLSGDHQLINAGLAVSLCKCWLQRTGNWGKIFHNVVSTPSTLTISFFK